MLGFGCSRLSGGKYGDGSILLHPTLKAVAKIRCQDCLYVAAVDVDNNVSRHVVTSHLYGALTVLLVTITLGSLHHIMHQ